MIKMNGKNIDVSDKMRDYTEKKMTYLDKFISPDDLIRMSVSKRGENIKVEAYLSYKKKDVKCKVENKDFYAAIDEVVEHLKNTVSRMHEQAVQKHRDGMKNEYKTQLMQEDEELREELESANS